MDHRANAVVGGEKLTNKFTTDETSSAKNQYRRLTNEKLSKGRLARHRCRHAGFVDYFIAPTDDVSASRSIDATVEWFICSDACVERVDTVKERRLIGTSAISEFERGEHVIRKCRTRLRFNLA